jgi:hydroxyacylglutathione hydrolase
MNRFSRLFPFLKEFSCQIVLRKAIIALLLSLCISSLSAQTNGWYTAKEIGIKTWVIKEPGFNENMYLLEGKDSALLIDAGFGMGNLRDFVKTLTGKPLIIVNTHLHPDHTGGDYQFPKVYIGADDREYAMPFLDPKVMKNIYSTMLKNIQIPDSLKFPDTLKAANTILVPLNDNYIFHLGERDIQVIGFPGHTAGSICLLDLNMKFLFTGDNNNTVWLFFKESLSVKTYLQSLKKLKSYSKQYNLLYSGHGDPNPVGLIDELITCCELILSGKCEAKPYHSMIGTDATSCTYQSVTIAYDANKVK